MFMDKRIRHFCTFPNQGGAGIAAWRLVAGLRSRGVDAELFGAWKFGDKFKPGQRSINIDRKFSNCVWRQIRKFQTMHIKKRLRKKTTSSGMPFFLDLSPMGQPMLECAKAADIIHLHWVCEFIDYEYFFSKLPVGVPIFWTLHDMNPFTGGCIHSMGCQRFQEACGKCPILDSQSSDDESARILQRKIQSLAPHLNNLCVITPSQWLGDLAQKSRVFSGARFRVIPNGVDLDIHHPRERQRNRVTNLATDTEKVLLFVAASLNYQYKGGVLLIDAWRELVARAVKAKVICMGDAKGFPAPSDWTLLNFSANEKDKAEVYASADVLVVPSEFENYPNVICEALACGVPVVGSHVGGIPEMVLDGKTGFTFQERSAICLADTIQKLLETLPNERAAWSNRCREFAEKTFCMTDIEERHIQLYDEVGINPEAILA
jgi:glycosyltransferase involved in cell wall biosynthesis